jgi:hypothetical protein
LREWAALYFLSPENQTARTKRSTALDEGP